MANFKAPDTVLNLYKDIPIADGLNIVFTSRSAQAAYFNARRHRQVSGIAHIRHTRGSVKIQGEVGELLSCDFLSFNNVAFGNGPIYARIVDAEYINPQNVEIFFEIDPWQTYMFDAEYRTSKIEREHLSESDWNKAEDEPYRDDVPELLTTEPLPVGKDLEISYRRNEATINATGVPWGGLLAADPKVEAGGVPGNLVQQFGREFSATTPTIKNPNSVVFQIAYWEESSAVEALFDATISRKAGYRNGFARGYFLGILDDGVGDDTDGFNTVIDDKFKAVLERMASDNVTHRILGIWVVPKTLLEADAHYLKTVGFIVVGTSAPVYSFAPLKYSLSPRYSFLKNPKLKRAPFTYLRVNSPSGETKTFEFERFSDPMNAKLRLYGNFDDTPSITVAPQSYNGHSLDFGNRLVHKAYPQVGYNIDGFLSHVGEQNKASVLGDSGQAAVDRYNNPGAYSGDNGAFGETSGIIKAGLGGAINGPTGVQRAGERVSMERAQTKFETERQNSAYDYFNSGDKPVSPYSHQKAALAGSGDYVAGNAENSLSVRLEQDCFEAITVMLKPEVLRAYDNYLTCYGYSSDRLGIPRVLGVPKGTGAAPYFVTFDELSFTYVKTEGMKVYGIPHMFARGIASLLDGGVRMIQGG